MQLKASGTSCFYAVSPVPLFHLIFKEFEGGHHRKTELCRNYFQALSSRTINLHAFKMWRVRLHGKSFKKELAYLAAFTRSVIASSKKGPCAMFARSIRHVAYDLCNVCKHLCVRSQSLVQHCAAQDFGMIRFPSPIYLLLLNAACLCIRIWADRKCSLQEMRHRKIVCVQWFSDTSVILIH